jgi:HlyD family secretion protein
VTTREEDGKKVKLTDAETAATSDEEIHEVVFILDADTAKMVTVETGIQDNEYIQILSGLEEGQVVVTGPYSTISRTLKNGLALEVKNEDEEKDKGKKDKD